MSKRRVALVLPLLVATAGNAIPYGLAGATTGTTHITTYEWVLSAFYAAAAILLLLYLVGWWVSRFAWVLAAACWAASVGHAIVLHHAIDRQRAALALIFAGYVLRALFGVMEHETEPASNVRDN